MNPKQRLIALLIEMRDSADPIEAPLAMNQTREERFRHRFVQELVDLGHAEWCNPHKKHLARLTLAGREFLRSEAGMM